MADTTTELEVLDEIVDVLGGQSGQYETVVPTLQQILALLGGGGGGYNPSLSVGRADALTGADSTAQWAQRESTGSGAATVRSVQGATVVWNQLDKDASAANWGKSYGSGNYTLSFADGVGTLVPTAPLNASEFSFGVIAIEASESTLQHKYLLSCEFMSNVAVSNIVHWLMSTNNNQNVKVSVSASSLATNTWHKVSAIIAQTDSSAFRVRHEIGIKSDNLTQSAEVKIRNMQSIDLTAMFGSGNEPSTVADFEAMYPEPYYPYSAPTLKPVRIAGIRSTDAQGGELDGVEWTAQTLRAAGSVRDELTSDELVTRVGQCVIDGVNVRATSIAAPSGSNTVYRCAVPLPFGSITITSAYYRAFNASHTFEFNINTLNSLVWANGNAMLYQYDGPTFLCCLDGVTTADEANAWFAAHPVTLTYPVTVVTQPISPALPMTYRVEQGGSESIIVPDGEVSAAPLLTVAEGESAAELVMDALACIATPDGPVATANHAINTYLTMKGKLYKVTSAIAVGETITPNTNVTETTVMAELIARTV